MTKKEVMCICVLDNTREERQTKKKNQAQIVKCIIIICLDAGRDTHIHYVRVHNRLTATNFINTFNYLLNMNCQMNILKQVDVCKQEMEEKDREYVLYYLVWLPLLLLSLLRLRIIIFFFIII